jgi:hypothetical protein
MGGTVLQWFLLLVIFFGLLLALGAALRQRETNPCKIKRGSTGLGGSRSLGALLIVGLFAVYHLVAGAYTEIPSDFWSRLGDVTDQWLLIELGRFSAVEGVSKLIDDRVYVPFIHGVVAYSAGLMPLDLVTPATLVTTLLFLLAVYYFALRIQLRLRISEKEKINIAIATTALTVLVFGVASFSYVRYYAYFPHILNMTLLLTVMSIFLDFLEERDGKTWSLALCAIFILVMGIVNTQEALFAMVLMTTTVVWQVGRKCAWQGGSAKQYALPIGLFGLALIFVTAIVISLGFEEKLEAYTSNPHLFDLGEIIPGLEGVLIANPELRFWDALGWFGVTVYIWFVFRWRWFKDQDYVCGAMLSPLLTLFNPLFVIWFLQVASWDPLWRLAFLIPIPYVAATLLIRSAGRVVERSWSASIIGTRVIFIVLVILIFPVQWGSFSNDNSRVPSLFSVDNKNGAGLWVDVIQYLNNNYEAGTFITDNVTNYVLHTATRHQGNSHPKMRWQKNESPFAGDYADRLTYYKRDGELVVVNHRDGELSVNGRVSGHWRENILKVSALYPPKLLDYLSSNPDEFELIWEKDNIFVFRIRGEGRE